MPLLRKAAAALRLLLLAYHIGAGAALEKPRAIRGGGGPASQANDKITGRHVPISIPAGDLHVIPSSSDLYPDMPVVRHLKKRKERKPDRVGRTGRDAAVSASLASMGQTVAVNQGPGAVVAARTKRLLTGYDKQHAPLPENGVLDVAIGFHLLKMLSLDHKENTVTVAGWLRQWWYDPRLAWDKDDSSVYNVFGVDSDKVWKPDSTLMNSVDFNYNENCQDVKAFVFAEGATVDTKDGAMRHNILWSRPCVWKAKCDVNLEYYPFDTNPCSLDFEPWTTSAVKFHISVQAEFNESTFKKSGGDNPEFQVDMEDMEAKRGKEILEGFAGFSRVEINMRLSRHGHYYVVNFICPIMMMLILSWLSLAMPLKHSDRIQYMVTVVLTVMAVNFITASHRPATDKNMWLDEFQTLSLLLVTSVTSYTVALYRFAPQEDWESERARRRMPFIKYVDRIARVVFFVVFIIMNAYLWGKLVSRNRATQEKEPFWNDVTGRASIFTYLVVGGIVVGMLFLIGLSWCPHDWYYKRLASLEKWRLEKEQTEEKI